MAAPLDYVRSELFDEAVDRHHRSYVSAILGGPLGAILFSDDPHVATNTPAVVFEVHNSYL
jgi:hypothetical protein